MRDRSNVTVLPDRTLPPVEAPAAGTLAFQVYKQLEARILAGEWLPGMKVSLRKLALSLDTSMQPVREAVGRLMATSALEVTPGRAIQVPALNRAMADELWAMRLLLEGEAAARFAARCRPDLADLLFEHTCALRKFGFGADLGTTMRSFSAWNRDLAEGSGAPILIEMIMRLRLRYAPFVAEALNLDVPFDKGFLHFTLAIQDELAMAIASGDATAARHLRCADLRSFQSYLYSRRGWDSPAAAGKRSDAERRSVSSIGGLETAS